MSLHHGDCCVGLLTSLLMIQRQLSRLVWVSSPLCWVVTDLDVEKQVIPWAGHM